LGEEAHTLCDLGRAVAGLNKDIATLGTESSGDGSGEGVDTVQQSLSALNTELELLEAIVSLWYGQVRHNIVPCGRNAAVAGKRNGASRPKGQKPGHER